MKDYQCGESIKICGLFLSFWSLASFSSFGAAEGQKGRKGRKGHKGLGFAGTQCAASRSQSPHFFHDLRDEFEGAGDLFGRVEAAE